MAVNEVQLTISVGDNGSLGVVAKKADAAAKSTGRLGKSTKDLGKVSDTTYRTMQGTAGTSSNLTKNFAKQAQGIQGGLVPAYATLAANVFAITAAFGALQRAAQVEQLVEGFTFLGNIAGRTATLVADSLVKITDNALSMEQALRAASAGMSAGFSTGELEGLAQVAKNAAQALGRDVGDATDRLIRGVGKLEPEILDELGIFVRLEPAVQKYAAALGKNANSLTEAERRQAFLNAALEQGERKFGNLSGQVDVNPYDKLAASFANLTKIFFNFVNQGLGPIVEFFANNMVALTGAAVMFGSTIVRSMLPVLDQLGLKSAENAEQVFQSAEKIKKAADASVSAKAKELEGFKTKLPKKNIYNTLKPSIVANTASNKELDDSIKAVSRTISAKEAALNKSTTKNISKIKMETEALRQELAVMQQLQAARSGQGQKFEEADIAETKAIASGLAADKAEAVQNADGIRDAFAKANSGFKEYKKDIGGAFQQSKKLAGGRLSKGLVSIKFAFEKAAVGARLFGIALVNAIPFIGQIITVGGIALGFLSDFFGRTTAVTEAQKQLNTVLETAGEKVDQYEKEVARLNEIATAQDKAATAGVIYANTLRIQAGFTDEFTSSLDKLVNAIIEEDVAEKGFFSSLAYVVKEGSLTVLNNIIKGFQEEIARLVRGLGILGEALINNPLTRFLGIDKFAASVGNAATSMNAAGREMELTRKINAAFNEAMEEGGVMADRLRATYGDDGSGFIAAVKKAQEKGLTFEQALAKTMTTLKASSKALNVESENVDNLSSSFSELTQSLIKFREAEAGKDKYATIASEIQDRITLLKTVQEDANKGADDNFASIIADKIKDGSMNLAEFGITAENVTDDVIGSLQNLADHFTAISDLQRTIKEEQKKMKLDTALAKAEVAGAKANRELQNMQEILKRFNKTSFAGLDFFDDILKTQKAVNTALETEFNNRRKIAELQFTLEVLEISAQMRLNAENTKRLEGLALELQIKAELYGITLETLDAEERTAKIRNQIDFIKKQEAQNNALLGAIKGADSAADAIRTLGSALESSGAESFKELFQIKDDDGKVISDGLETRIEALKATIAPMVESLKSLGPQGEAIATAIQGIYTVIDAFLFFNDTVQQVMTNISERIQDMIASGDMDLSKAIKVEEMVAVAAAGTALVAASVSALMQTLAAATRNRIAGVDKEIEAEKNRDGKSKESLARIQQLEKKKENLKRKEFEQNKKAMMAQAVMATAMGIANAAIIMGIPGMQGFAIALMAMIGALGAAQLAVISGMSYSGGGAGSAGGGAATSISAGERKSTVDMAKSQGARGEIGYMRGEAGVGGPENFTPAFGGYRNRAEGGNAAFMVGEQGPELFVPNRAGTIVPNDDITGGGTTNVSFNINTIDASGVEDMLTVQRGNIIGMIRDAANSYGEDFVESVDTSILTPTAGAGASRY